MESLTGEIGVQHGGQQYSLMLGLRGIAKLQAKYGKDLAVIRHADAAAEELPDLGVYLDIVDIALERHHPDATPALGEQMLMADMALPGRLLAAAFPSADVDAAKTAKASRPGKKPARR